MSAFLAVLVPFSTHVAPNMVTMGSRETILPTSNPSECPSHSLDHLPQTTFIAAPQSLCRYIDVWSWRGGNFFCRRDDSDLIFGPFRSRLSDRLGWEQGLIAWGERYWLNGMLNRRLVPDPIPKPIFRPIFRLSRTPNCGLEPGHARGLKELGCRFDMDIERSIGLSPKGSCELRPKRNHGLDYGLESDYGFDCRPKRSYWLSCGAESQGNAWYT